MVKGLNPSFIVLILKNEEASALSDFRPTSLIGGIYKIISKVLARRLSKVMGSVISEQQAAFVGERNILDSIVVLNEVIEEMKRKKEECMIFKIDLVKAYALIEWSYLRIILER